MASTYMAKDITVLEGLEPVRKRPAMYIGGLGKDGYHHLLTELIDNSVDEAMNGHASRVELTLAADRRSVSVRDDGRGIPTDEHPKLKKPALQTADLHALAAKSKAEKKKIKPSYGTHIVSQGESGWLIAKKLYKISLKQLRDANPSANLDRLKIGQLLRIPKSL